MTTITPSTAAPAAPTPPGTMMGGDVAEPSPWRVPVVCGVVWCLAALVVMGWVFGMPTRTVQQSPDEAITALATVRIAEVGRPELDRLPDDGGMLRPRMWVPVGEHNVPAAAPGSLEAYGAVRMLPGGAAALYVVPAVGVGAWVAAAGLLLPARRRWLAVLLPGLAAPATYWLLRPFHNVSLELALVGLGVLAAVVGHRSARRWPLPAVMAAAVAASLVRPDHVHVLVGAVVLWSWWRHRDRWGALVAVVAAGAVVWVGANALMNVHLTGAPLTTPTSLLDFPSEVRGLPNSISGPVRLVLLIVLPNLIPSLSTLSTQLAKYWVAFGAAFGVLVLAVFGGVQVWRQVVRRDRVALGVGAAGLVLFALSRVSDTDLGAAASVGQPVHSYPRYTAVVYLTAGILALVAVGTARGWWARAGAALVGVFTVAGLVAIATPAAEGEGLLWLRGQLHAADGFRDAVVEQFDEDTVVFSLNLDKYLAGQRRVGLLRPERTLPGDPPVFVAQVGDAMQAAIDAGLTPVVLGVGGNVMDPLGVELADRGLCVDPRPVTLPEVEGIATWEPAHVVRDC